ncbi:hypothetical protein HELRODRAFT_193199 [Helobdella robusta]|uniref:SH3 domain-containing protein n=1 Tax=Helobdella robusta TaxID=6412 RepID=T1FUQ8_HELRO|nr:hypothetical protein HELRODRAFT_193199 [Helobdella robusta]ESN97787.1 hypothetical protein HELRODRAFT_193199 [Helobdella robusta]
MPIGMMESPTVLQKIQCTKIKKSKDPEFVLKVVCNDCPAHEITRKHQDLCDFITELITCYPKFAKDLPKMKGCDWFNRGFFKNKNCKIEIDNFCQKLLDLPEDVRNDEMMVTFFSSLSAFQIACSKKKREIAEQNGIGEPSYDCLALIPSENETKNNVIINDNIYGEGLQKTFNIPPVDKVVKTSATSKKNQSDSEVYESSTAYALYCDIDLNKEVKCKDSNAMRSCKVKCSQIYCSSPHDIPVIKPHTATDVNEISVQVGQLVEILDNLPIGLVKIRWSGRVGFVPNVCLDLKEKNSVMKFGMASSDQSKVKPVANVPPLSGPHTKTEDNIEQEVALRLCGLCGAIFIEMYFDH